MATAKGSAKGTTVDTPEDAPKTTGGAVATIEQLRDMSKLEKFTDANLRAITSFEDAFALAQDVYSDVVDITAVLGNGFTLTTDKKQLVGKKMVIVHFGLNEGDFGEFASLALVTAENKKFIINDGSTGIKEQLLDLARTHHRFGGYLVPNGLNESEYPTCFECGTARPTKVDVCGKCGDTTEKRAVGTTYYLDLTPAS